MEGADIIESPRKRVKVDNTPSTEDAVLSEAPAAEAVPVELSETDAQAEKERKVGITEFVSAENEGFAGILKKRYTDFLVNEILPSGEVLHLQNITAPNSSDDKNETETPKTETPAPAPEPKPEPPVEEAAPAEETPKKEFELSEEDKTALEELFGAESTQKIVALHVRALAKDKLRPSDLGKIPTTVVTDRDLRIKMHQTIRRVFNSQLESSTDGDGTMVISVASNRNNRSAKSGPAGKGQDRGRVNWDELGGPYLHFTIYKENKDTMEIITFIARQLRMNPKSFQFAGTKDRRGVTAQRACAHRVLAERIVKLNNCLRNASIGDFEYRQTGLELGDLSGNEFVVTLRECDIPGIDLTDREAAVAKANEHVSTALRNLRERGYFNYYGLQRFGTFATRTDMVGVQILRGDYKGACDSILDYNRDILTAPESAQISSDDRARAEAISMFQAGGKANEAVEKLPRKFSAEASLMRHLSKSQKDFRGALQAIPRNLRLMYAHAYQSLVWNFAVGERWRLYGDKVVEGDLVLIHEHRDKDGSASAPAPEQGDVDADGEVIIAPQGLDSAYTEFERARALTAEEAASGAYSISDIVMTLPGFDVLYPPNAMTDFYKTFMASEQGGGLDPFDMRRTWKDISLPGSYRKILIRMGPDYSSEVRLYSRDDEQFVQTDLEKLKGKKNEIGSEGEGDKLAVVIKFQLGSSQYATMALRELMRGKVKAYKPDFGGGRG